VTEAYPNDVDERQWEGKPSDREGAARTPGQRDRDRILYCSAFHRLAYVTQVTAPEGGHAFHNRLTHSLKVAQVGRRNAERLRRLAENGKLAKQAADLVGLLDPDSVEASCLAHDLGHPPFGHIAEHALNHQARKTLRNSGFDAFEGNAQSFRIVTGLAVRDKEWGLDLSRRTLDGLLKYPWPDSNDTTKKAHRKWGYYGADADAFDFVKKDVPEPSRSTRSLAAEIMDWADDLTYAVHDLDDFFRAGLIPLHLLGDPNSASERDALGDLLREAKEAEPASFPEDPIDDLLAAVSSALELHGPQIRYEHTRSNRAVMRELGSKLITRYLQAFRLDVDGSTGLPCLRIDPDCRIEVEALKCLVRVYVIRRPGLAVVQHGQDRLIRRLFDRYYEASDPGEAGDGRVFPPGARERLATARSTEERARVVIDLIAGLTEDAAVKLDQRLSGGSTSSEVLDATADVG
jgi:dGTPase